MIVVCVGYVDHIAFVTIAAFDPAGIFGDRKPDTRVAKRTFTAVATDFPCGDCLGFWGSYGHLTLRQYDRQPRRTHARRQGFLLCDNKRNDNTLIGDNAA
jgi:hypothetical protein